MYAAFANFSAALQLLFVLDFRLVLMSLIINDIRLINDSFQILHSLVSRLEDSAVIVGCYLLALALLLIVNVREHILVSSFTGNRFREQFDLRNTSQEASLLSSTTTTNTNTNTNTRWWLEADLSLQEAPLLSSTAGRTSLTSSPKTLQVQLIKFFDLQNPFFS